MSFLDPLPGEEIEVGDTPGELVPNIKVEAFNYFSPGEVKGWARTGGFPLRLCTMIWRQSDVGRWPSSRRQLSWQRGGKPIQISLM